MDLYYFSTISNSTNTGITPENAQRLVIANAVLAFTLLILLILFIYKIFAEGSKSKKMVFVKKDPKPPKKELEKETELITITKKSKDFNTGVTETEVDKIIINSPIKSLVKKEEDEEVVIKTKEIVEVEEDVPIEVEIIERKKKYSNFLSDSPVKVDKVEKIEIIEKIDRPRSKQVEKIEKIEVKEDIFSNDKKISIFDITKKGNIEIDKYYQSSIKKPKNSYYDYVKNNCF